MCDQQFLFVADANIIRSRKTTDFTGRRLKFKWAPQIGSHLGARLHLMAHAHLRFANRALPTPSAGEARVQLNEITGEQVKCLLG